MYSPSIPGPRSFATASMSRWALAVALLGGLTELAPPAHAQGGVPLWTNHYHGGFGADRAVAIVIDKTGHVVVTGASVGQSGDDDYATVAYSNAGDALWTNRYNG